MESYTFKWFTIWLLIWSVLFTVQGLIWLFNPGKSVERTHKAIQNDNPPASVLSILKYSFLFGVISIFLAFFPFRLIPLIYSIWIVAMVFIVGRLMLNWTSFSTYWNDSAHDLDPFYRKTGAFTTALGLITFALCYLHIQSSGM